METNVPIIVRLIEVYKLWHDFLPNMAKTSRYTLGQKIDDLFIETTELIFLASHLSKEQKLPSLQKAVAKLDLLKTISPDLVGDQSHRQYKNAMLSEPLEEVGRMLGGWVRQTASRTQPAGHRTP